MLAVRPLGILVLHCRDRDHFAVITLAAQPAKKERLSNSVSSRSVLARRCSRDTATLDA